MPHQLVRSLHAFLRQHAFYAQVLASALACAMLAARVLHAHQTTYLFLVWNLFLAWVPYGLSLAVAAVQRQHPRAWWRLVLPVGLWLLFLPNAPYLVTDFIHLRERPPVPLWFDMGMLAAFGLSGCFLAVVSLQMVQHAVALVCGRFASWLFVVVCVALSGLGVYLGRFERWNSWDIALHPRAVLADAVRPLLYPLSHVEPLAASAMFAALLFTCYLTFVSRVGEERP